MGANNSIQHAGVQYILDSVIPALEANPARKFSYVEQAFFQRYWREADASLQERIKAVVKSGQLEFLNGGWAMHDEAATHYVNMVDQTALGHSFLQTEFSYVPTIGWQIDPFGHSSTQASLLSAEAGFDALYFGRIDYQDHKLRMNQSRMEMVWRASPSLGSSSQVFTGAFQSGNYGPPSGFCFDQFCSDPPMQTDKRLEDYNVEDRVNAFVDAVNQWLSHKPAGDNHVMFKMGSDFQHENSNEWMKNLDKLIDAVNADGRVHAFYSTPVGYTKAVNELGLTWEVKTDDFFPYADCPNCVWAGYFTSRPALKGFVRAGSAFIQSVRQLDALSGGDGTVSQELYEALSVATHHDAVSGTAKQHVAFDYAKRIAKGTATASEFFTSTLATMMTPSSGGGPKPALSQCQYLNMSSCDALNGATTGGLGFAVVVYNPMGQSRTEPIRVPVSANNGQVTDSKGSAVASDTTPNVATPRNANTPTMAPYTITFEATIPAFGYATYFVTAKSSENGRTDGQFVEPEVVTPAAAHADADVDEVDANQVLESDTIAIQFDTTTGKLVGIKNKKTGVFVTGSHEFKWYNSSAGDNGWGSGANQQHSGAYIFRPNASYPDDPYKVSVFPVATGPVKLTISDGTYAHEATQVWAPWLSSVIRLYDGQDHFELEWTVGPIPFDDGLGKEVVSVFSTNISSAMTWYTDSNGRELITRQRDYRPTWKLNLTEPVADNYFPVDAAITIKDANAQLTVLTDRAEGGTSLQDGEIELMVHRRLLYDDSRGVGEPLNETQSITPYPNPKRIGTGLVVRGKHTVLLDAPGAAFANVRPMMDRVFLQPQLAFASLGSQTPAQFSADHTVTASHMQTELPDNVGLMTLQPRPDGVVLRLAHRFAVGEDPKLSQPATVSLATLFSGLTVANVTELSLTANQPLSNVHRMTWKTKTTYDIDGNAVATDSEDGGAAANVRRNRDAPTGPNLDVTLGPMEIRTFLVQTTEQRRVRPGVSFVEL